MRFHKLFFAMCYIPPYGFLYPLNIYEVLSSCEFIILLPRILGFSSPNRLTTWVLMRNAILLNTEISSCTNITCTITSFVGCHKMLITPKVLKIMVQFSALKWQYQLFHFFYSRQPFIPSFSSHNIAHSHTEISFTTFCTCIPEQ